MNKIRRYVEEFFSTTRKPGDCELKGSEITAFFLEIGDFDARKIADGLTCIFEYGYAKGYRAAMNEAQNGVQYEKIRRYIKGFLASIGEADNHEMKKKFRIEILGLLFETDDRWVLGQIHMFAMNMLRE